MSTLLGDRYRHPGNKLLERWLELDKPYADYEETCLWYKLAAPALELKKGLSADEIERRLKGLAFWGCNDRFFLFTHLCGRIDALHPWLFDRCREVEADPDGHIDLWSRFHYKAVAVDAPVPTPTGYRKHGELRPGDQVFGPDGKPCNVIARTKTFVDAGCYRVTFDGGFSVVVSGDHLWTVSVNSRRRIGSGTRRDMNRSVTVNTRELREYAAKRLTWSESYGTRPFIPVSAALEYSAKDLPVAPYLLGLWLGDGHTAAGTITCGFEDTAAVVRALRSDGHRVCLHKRPHCYSLTVDDRPKGKCLRGHSRREAGALYRGQCVKCKAQRQRHRLHGDPTAPVIFRSLHIQLRDAGLLDNKHIPDLYLRASVDQRRALLQGLMDSDGHCDQLGGAIFCNSDERVARGVFDLAASLGLKPSIRRHQTKVNGNPYPFWHVAFQVFADQPAVFRLRRKQARATDARPIRSRRHMVVSVEPVATEPCSCIQVDRLDGLYLIGRECVATHNSSLITFAGCIQEIVRNPEIKIAIFSVVKPIAAAFLGQIKDEFEANELLRQIYRDVLYENPRTLGSDGRPSKWGLARGITVKRTSNPKEATIEAHGLIDGQPTSRHFDLHVYDDMVTQDYLTEDSIRKTTERWEMADNLGSHLGVRKWMPGTRYHYADTYSVVLERGSMKPRIYPATDNGKLDGKPVFLSQERWDQIKRDQRSTVSAQCLLNPIAGNEATFNTTMLRGYDVFPAVMNVYILVDPSKGKTQRSDRTAIAAVGVDQGGTKYLLDGFRHRMKLSERWQYVSRLKEKWERHPGVQMVKVGWERYGKDAEIEAIEDIQLRENNVFEIEELNTPRQGAHSKNDRIERLEPDFRQQRFLLPLLVHNPDSGGRCTWVIWTEELEKIAARSGKNESHPVGTIVYRPIGDRLTKRQQNCAVTAQRHRIVEPIKRFDENKDVYDLTRAFIDEFIRHPFATHDDLIDAVSRVYDIDPQIPVIYEAQSTDALPEDDYEPIAV